jgi:hypothetical protein
MNTTDSFTRRLDCTRGLHANDYKAASLAAKLADTCVSASFLPDLWTTYYERFHGVLRAELTGRDL